MRYKLKPQIKNQPHSDGIKKYKSTLSAHKR